MSKLSLAEWSAQLKPTDNFLGILKYAALLLLNRFLLEQFQHFLGPIDMHTNFVILAIFQKL